jgi:hypothetical protein
MNIASSKVPALAGLHERLMLFALSLALGAVLGIYGTVGWAMANKLSGTDFFKFYLSSVRRHHSVSLYWPAPTRSDFDRLCGRPTPLMSPLEDNPDLTGPSLAALKPCLHPNLNPPFFGVLTRPLGYLDPGTAWWVWGVLSLLSFGAALWLIWHADSRLPPPWYAPALFVIGAFAYFPVSANFLYGQMGFFIFLPITLSWRALRAGREQAGGAWLGLAVGLKPFTGLLLPLLLLNGRWRATLAAAGSLALNLIAGGLAGGFDAYVEYTRALGSVTWFGASWNASFQGFFMRILGGAENTPWMDLPWLAMGLTVCFNLTVIAILAWLAWRSRRQHPEFSADLVFATALPAMLLVSPLGWLYYMPVLILSAWVLWRFSAALPKRRTYRGLMLLGYGLTSLPALLIVQRDIHGYPRWFWEASYYFYGLSVVFIAAVLISRLACHAGLVMYPPPVKPPEVGPWPSDQAKS